MPVCPEVMKKGTPTKQYWTAEDKYGALMYSRYSRYIGRKRGIGDELDVLDV